MQKSSSNLRALCEGAILVAMAVVLSFVSDLIPFLSMPRGGSVTLCSMVPIVLMSYRHGVKWGCLAGLADGIIQLLMGLKNLSYCPTLASQIGCVLLDYLLAFTILGLASAFVRRPKVWQFALSAAAVCLLRYLCSTLSGYFVWYDYATATGWLEAFSWGGKLVSSLGEHALCWWYSVLYNLSYMLPETIITVAGVSALSAAAPRLFARQK